MRGVIYTRTYRSLVKEKSLSVPERGEQIPDENKKTGKEKTKTFERRKRRR
ncbi:hypothetical protein GI596_21010 (plasmid) [Bacillus paranthracis]|nr:hypothetical protein [Bacillus paranthracis]NUJ08523.1 hypothetical protein [Bacillus paranthracis]